MHWGAFPTRFEGWSRGPALAVIGALLALLALATWSPATAPAPKVRSSPTQQSDLQLYRDIISGVAAGRGYYEVAAEELRKGNYPLKPFFTFRLPTHATIYAAAGERAMIVIVWAMCVALMLAWWVKLRPLLPLSLLALTMFLLAGGLGGMLQPQTGLFHESWAALLLALTVALHKPGKIWPAVVLGGAALMIRELALPMILAMGGLALLEKRWREAAAWGLAVVLFGLYMTLHAHWVAGVLIPTDPPSPGWSRPHGLQFALKSMAKVTFGIRLADVAGLALLALSLFGWASVKTGWALRATLLVAGYAIMLALFARPDTFYWALIPAPLAFVGLAFLPKALADLAKAVRQAPYPAT
jgi:diacylglycerol kinase